MSKKKDRIIVLVALSVDRVTLPKRETDLFQITWKCASKEGMTERVMADDQEVAFEKRFRFTTAIKTVNETKLIPKFVKFKVCRFRPDKTVKIFGRAEIDLTTGMTSSSTLTTVVVLDSPHKEKSSLLINLNVKELERNKLRAQIDLEPDLTSESQAFQLTQDKTSSWDVSETVAEDDVKSFLEYRKNKEKQLQIQLASFVAPNTIGTKRKRRKTFRMPKGVKMLIDPKDEENAKALADFFKSASGNRDAERTKSVGRYLSHQQALSMIKEITHFKWGESPVTCDPVCIPAAVFYAAFLRCSLFDSSSVTNFYFRRLMQTFFAFYEERDFLYRCSNYDMFLNSIHLYALLSIPVHPPFDEERVERFRKSLMRVIGNSFCALIDMFCEPIDRFTTEVIKKGFDFPRCLYNFAQIYANITSRNMPQPIMKLVAERFIEIVDGKLVNMLLANDHLISFTNASLWNYFITIAAAENPGSEFPKFREANSAIMMSQVLCLEPERCRDICPTLPKAIVLKLLKNQVPDDMQPILRDTIAFEQLYKKQIHEEDCSLLSPLDNQFDPIIQNTDVSQWTTVVLPKESFKAFDFLSAFFKQAE